MKDKKGSCGCKKKADFEGFRKTVDEANKIDLSSNSVKTNAKKLHSY